MMSKLNGMMCMEEYMLMEKSWKIKLFVRLAFQFQTYYRVVAKITYKRIY